MKRFSSLSHIVWDCKCHLVWIPKCRRKVLYVKLRNYLGELFHELAHQRECQIIEGHLCADHIHMCIAIPPKHSVSEVVGFIKGKSAIAIARDVQLDGLKIFPNSSDELYTWWTGVCKKASA